MSDLQFVATIVLVGSIVWLLAVRWSRWDMRRAIIKDQIKMHQQDEAIRRLTQR